METVNHEYYVSLEVAKLLEKAGFDWVCRGNCVGGDVFTDGLCGTGVMNNSEFSVLRVPALDVAQRWLREVKDIYIMVFKDFTTIDGWHYFVVKKEDWESGNESNFYQQESNNHTYEEAQEASIKKALEIILEKGE